MEKGHEIVANMRSTPSGNLYFRADKIIFVFDTHQNGVVGVREERGSCETLDRDHSSIVFVTKEYPDRSSKWKVDFMRERNATSGVGSQWMIGETMFERYREADPRPIWRFSVVSVLELECEWQNGCGDPLPQHDGPPVDLLRDED